MDKDKEYVPREVYTGPSWEARLIRYLLKDNNIEVIFVDKTNTPILPNSIIPDSWQDVTVLVNNLDYEKAMVIVYEKDIPK